MELSKLREHLSQRSIDDLEDEYSALKVGDNCTSSSKLQDLIFCFISTDDIGAVNNMSMLLAYLDLEIAPALIVGKLLSGQYNEEGGTLLYSLLDLDHSAFDSELKRLWKLDISFEMQNMLQLLDIPEE